MATNTIKKEPKPNLFTRIDEKLSQAMNLENGVSIRWLPHILYVSLLLIFYIGNSHYAEKTIRKIDHLKTEVEDLRADYTTLKSDYMFAGKQSEVAKRMAPKGIYESLRPPQKVVIRKGEY
ncbi:MAG: hypothetical protein LAT68_08005 [Cyclobacteriaceae bacterium]|nr:hypothetical protein [Cyclobacteriaceae bacterium]MCH8516257.1 hypothetical protein [Cyclobacteriaceae bacterium]